MIRIGSGALHKDKNNIPYKVSFKYLQAKKINKELER